MFTRSCILLLVFATTIWNLTELAYGGTIVGISDGGLNYAISTDGGLHFTSYSLGSAFGAIRDLAFNPSTGDLTALTNVPWGGGGTAIVDTQLVQNHVTLASANTPTSPLNATDLVYGANNTVAVSDGGLNYAISTDGGLHFTSYSLGSAFGAIRDLAFNPSTGDLTALTNVPWGGGGTAIVDTQLVQNHVTLASANTPTSPLNATDLAFFSPPTAAVPEPASLTIFGVLGAISLLGGRRMIGGRSQI